MIAKLPRWVWAGGSLLAFIAGMINAVGFLGFQHQAVTHLTGTTTQAGLAVASGGVAETMHLFAVLGSFLAGAVFSGFLVRESTLQLGRRYGVALAVESLLLFLAVPFLEQHHVLGDYLASAACGLQNAMASTYSGTVIRTTHFSGMFTDLGIALGHLLRGLPVDRRRIRLALLLISAFFAGGIGGGIAFGHLQYAALYLPAALTGLTGLAYTAYRHAHRVPVLSS